MRTEPLKKTFLIAERLRILRNRLETILNDEQERGKSDTKSLCFAIDDELNRLLDTIENLQKNQQ